ncbi:transcription factor CP2-like isoform X2 [Oscarella lobularis]|uniref:transcription factor CP2-like isoform X2 n=1 Tax=Oscarella lobularis TaxID=121494 RepID=UPI0033140B86
MSKGNSSCLGLNPMSCFTTPFVCRNLYGNGKTNGRHEAALAAAIAAAAFRKRKTAISDPQPLTKKTQMASQSGWSLDDLDDVTLAAELSEAVENLGSDIQGAYNMRDVLALDMFKGSTNVSSDAAIASGGGGVGVGLQMLLCAATSPATRVTEETLTNLNRGQAYELKMKGVGNVQHLEGQIFKTVLKICFHERKYQSSEADQWDIWRHEHPGERVLDVEFASCYNLTDIVCDPSVITAAIFSWDPTKETGVFFKANCLSTEFSARKHGGEKGVPLKIQLDTFDANDRHVHSAGCQIKIFKDKGADRKNKLDMQRLEKRSQQDMLYQGQYQPSFDYTILTEQPLDSSTSTRAPNLSSIQYIKPDPGAYDSYASSAASSTCSTPLPHSNSNSKINMVGLSSPETRQKLYRAAYENSRLSGEANRDETRAWLEANHFGHCLAVLGNFTGADLLRLTREEMTQICGPAEGIRLDNALQLRALRPRCVLYFSIESEQIYHAVYLETLTLYEFTRKLADKLKISLEHVTGIHRLVPSNVFVIVDDEMVKTFVSEMTFQVQVMKGELGQCRIIMKG